MKTKHTLFTEVISFYTNLATALAEAQDSISPRMIAVSMKVGDLKLT